MGATSDLLGLTPAAFERIHKKMAERKATQSTETVLILGPHVKKVINEGVEAARVGQKYNPYQKNTLAHDLWDLGYDFPQDSGR